TTVRDVNGVLCRSGNRLRLVTSLDVIAETVRGGLSGNPADSGANRRPVVLRHAHGKRSSARSGTRESVGVRRNVNLQLKRRVGVEVRNTAITVVVILLKVEIKPERSGSRSARGRESKFRAKLRSRPRAGKIGLFHTAGKVLVNEIQVVTRNRLENRLSGSVRQRNTVDKVPRTITGNNRATRSKRSRLREQHRNTTNEPGSRKLNRLERSSRGQVANRLRVAEPRLRTASNGKTNASGRSDFPRAGSSVGHVVTLQNPSAISARDARLSLVSASKCAVPKIARVAATPASKCTAEM